MPFGDVFKRMGKTRTKVTFFIEVQTLVITPISGLDSGDDLNVLFERGDKSVSSAPKTLTESRKDKNLTADFSEILRLDATMYKDSHGVFQVIDCSDKDVHTSQQRLHWNHSCNVQIFLPSHIYICDKFLAVYSRRK